MQTIVENSQYLTFRLGRERYAADVSRVKEVLALVPVTRLPRMPEFMEGVINIRGQVVPVVNLRRKFDMTEVENSVDTSIIVMDVNVESKSLTVGCLADSVEQVVGIPADKFQDAPSFGTKVDSRFIEAIASDNDEFIIVLDMNRVFGMDEIEALDSGARSSE